VVFLVTVPIGEVQELKPATGEYGAQATKTVTFRARVIDSETKKPVAGIRVYARR